MTTVTFLERDGRLTGFEAKGHAMYASYGSDIVCAAISVLTINTVNVIEALNHEEVVCKKDDEAGRLVFSLRSERDVSTQRLLEALRFGLIQIGAEYGKQYIQVVTKEVE